jgi:hydroxymethylpyrimidine pyrophosphatase-like HAD family hydrolase
MSLICFDLDGTLANIEHRLGYVRSKPKNWRAFDAGIPNDAVNLPVAAAFNALYNAGHDIIFASGRNERSRAATVSWLDANGFWWTGASLYMRKADDYRSDDIVKDEIIDQIVADYGKLPDMWFDDRPRVVRAVRKRGIFVFDVYQGEEDF